MVSLQSELALPWVGLGMGWAGDGLGIGWDWDRLEVSHHEARLAMWSVGHELGREVLTVFFGGSPYACCRFIEYSRT